MTSNSLNVVVPSGVLTLVVLYFAARRGVIDPEKMDAKPRDIETLPAVVWLAGACIMYVSLGVGIKLFANMQGMFRNQLNLGEDAIKSLSLVGGYGFAILMGAVLLWLLKPRVTENTGLRVQQKDLLDGLIGFVCILPICVIVSVIAQAVATRMMHKEPDLIAHEGLKDIVRNINSVDGWLLIIGACIGAPIAEELTYRVFLQSLVLNVTRSAALSVVVTSVLFTLVHLGRMPWHGLPVIFVLSLGLGVIYERNKGMLAPIVIHMLFNISNVVLAVWQT